MTEEYYVNQFYRLKDENKDLRACIERLRNGLQRIERGATSVLIHATLDECPINPDVLEQIVKDAGAALGPVTPADRAEP